MSYFKYWAVACCTTLLVVGLQEVARAQQSWRKIQPMSTARFFSGAAAISDHEVLVIGGYTSGFASTASCEIVNVLTNTVLPAQSLLTGRTDFAMVQLPDSNIVVLGGVNDGIVGSIEMYDRATQKWSKIGDLQVPRRQLIGLLISPTKILTVGGRNRDLDCLRDCEIFDLATRTSRRVQDYPVITSLCKVERTSIGKIVAFGGREGGPGSTRQKEMYEFDVKTERWSLYGAYPSPIYFPSVVTLPNGKLFSTGGSYAESGNAKNDYSDLLAIESLRGFDSVGHLRGLRDLHCAALYDDYNVIVIGGANENGTALSTCEIVDPAFGSSSVGPELNEARDLFNVVRLRPAARRGDKIDAVLVAIGGRGLDTQPLQSVEVLDVQCDGGKTIDLVEETGNVRMNGSAQWFGKRIRLTDTSENDSGSAWYADRLSIRNGFETDFTFRIGSGSDRTQPDGGDPGADGIAFVIQNNGTTALGHYGKGIGYAGIQKSVAVEFDTYFNFESSDPNGNHVAIQTGGTLANQAEHRAPFLLGSSTALETIHNDGRPYFGRITYDGSAMFVYVNETGIFTTPVLTVANIDIASLIGLGPDRTAWIGFTSATGIAWAQHEILDWKIRGCVQTMLTSVDGQEKTSAEPSPTFELSPNPVNSTLSIRVVGHSTGDMSLRIFDVQGTPMSCLASDAIPVHGEMVRVDTSCLPTGCYIVRIESSGSTMCSRLVVLH